MSETPNEGHRERLRRRFLAGEQTTQTDAALLELLLCFAIPRRDVQPLAADLIARHGSLEAVLALDHDTLRRQHGITEQAAVLLRLVDTIRRREAQEGSGIAAGHGPAQLALLPDTADAHRAPSSAAAAETPLSPGEPETAPDADDKPLEESEAGQPESRGPIAQPRTGLFGKAMLKEAIDMLPRLPDTESLDEVRAFLRANLPFSFEQTRQRNTSYVVSRMFPSGRADSALRRFAVAFADGQELRDVCFYRFCVAEPLMLDILDELLLPALGKGRVQRSAVREYLNLRFPDSRSTETCSTAVLNALEAGGGVGAYADRLTVAYRQLSLPSFAFILHSEFPEPGMYDIGLLERSRPLKAMLWQPDQIVPALYELRNRGLVNKVSEIDTVRQFTTRWTLDEMVEQLLSDGEPA